MSEQLTLPELEPLLKALMNAAEQHRSAGDIQSILAEYIHLLRKATVAFVVVGQGKKSIIEAIDAALVDPNKDAAIKALFVSCWPNHMILASSRICWSIRIQDSSESPIVGESNECLES